MICVEEYDQQVNPEAIPFDITTTTTIDISSGGQAQNTLDSTTSFSSSFREYSYLIMIDSAGACARGT